jgi:hypothetical protein
MPRLLIRGSQCAVIDGHVEDAVAKGATVMCGARHEKQFYWPTVLKGVTPDMRIYHEESFGPITSIIKVDGHEEALRIANDTSYGLSSAVITNDMQKALDLAFGLSTSTTARSRTSRMHSVPRCHCRWVALQGDLRGSRCIQRGFSNLRMNSSIGVGEREDTVSRLSSGWRKKSPSPTSLKPAASTSRLTMFSSIRCRLLPMDTSSPGRAAITCAISTALRSA